MLLPFISGIFLGVLIAIIVFLTTMYCDYFHRSKINARGILPSVSKRITRQEGEILYPLSPLEQSMKDNEGKEVKLEDLI